MAESEPSVFYDAATNTLSYLLVDPGTRRAAIIDPVLDFDPRSGRTTTTSADRIVAAAEGMHVDWILETHCHADHLSGAAYLKAKLGGATVIGAGIDSVQRTWAKIYNLGPEFTPDGRQFDRLLRDGERIALGSLEIECWSTPGHTPACSSYVIRPDGAPRGAFVGDTLFMPDYGTARCDFPGGDAATLYRSIQRLLSLPEATPLYMCHDYQPGGRPMAYRATVAEQRANIHLKDGSLEKFVAFRAARDKTLSAPNLLLPSIQVNIRAGVLPPAEANGVAYLKLPLNVI